jgi:predicted Fe-Mo cluster-binding NifX family protein
MKIAIPSSEDMQVFPHFGRCPFYVIIDSESGVRKCLPNSSIHSGGSKSPPEILSDEGVDVLVCNELGRKALMMFKNLNITVYVGAKGTLDDAILSWERGELQTPEKDYSCEGHEGENDLAI